MELDAQQLRGLRELWTRLMTAVEDAVVANCDYDTARDNAMSAAELDYHDQAAFERANEEYEVASKGLAASESHGQVRAARDAIVEAYRGYFGERGVQIVEDFLSALQSRGTGHDLVSVGRLENAPDFEQAKAALFELTPIP